MIEERKFNKCELIDDGDNILKVIWDMYIDSTYSHSYEQLYTKETKQQFISDVGEDAAQNYLQYF